MANAGNHVFNYISPQYTSRFSGVMLYRYIFQELARILKYAQALRDS